MNCIDLGLVPYREALRLQDYYVNRRIRGEIGDTLLFLEHPSVVVMGRGGSGKSLLLSPAELATRGIEFAESNRGGGATFHCPGQLVAYPIVDLSPRGRDLHLYMRKLEEIVIGLLSDFGVPACRIAGRTGVFVGGAKIASIGVAARRWVVFHGLALNANNNLAGFSFIDPCGFRGLPVTSLSKVLGRRIAIQELMPGLLEHSSRVLGGMQIEERRRISVPVG